MCAHMFSPFYGIISSVFETLMDKAIFLSTLTVTFSIIVCFKGFVVELQFFAATPFSLFQVS